MVDKITSPVGANDVIKKINDAIDAIPTSTTQLTNDSGFITGITSSMVTSALGYTPYNSTNPSGYQANVLETIKVNGTAQTPSSKTVDITVPTTTSSVTSGSAAALTSGGAYTNLLRLSGAQTVSGNKTFSATTTISGTISLGSNATATTPTSSDNSTKVATTAFVKAQGYTSLTSITYANLVTAKTNGTLVPGSYYRITDYVTTTNGAAAKGSESGAPTEASRSAGHAFDIIVEAIGTNQLSDLAACALHSGDTYFASQNVGAWQIWYDIENNTAKYEWADTTNGKGVIYRMIDEFDNDLPYDFKNIQFYRDDTSSRYTTVAGTLKATDDYYFTFSKVNTSTGAVTDLTLDANAGSVVCNNHMKAKGGSGTGVTLNNNIFVANSTGTINTCNNVMGQECYANTFLAPVYNNKFDGILTYSNVIGPKFYYNSVGTTFYQNIISVAGTCDRNSFYANFYKNTIKTASGDFFNNKTFGACYNWNINTTNKVGRNIFEGTAIGISMSGGEIIRNIFGDGAENISIDSMTDSYVGPYTYNIQIVGYNSCLNIGAQCENLSVAQNLCNIVVAPKTIGASNSNKLSLSGLPTNTNYPIYVRLDENGKPIATWNDGGKTVGLKKDTLTDASWTELPSSGATYDASTSTLYIG